jgi:hypothetical protein
MNVWGINGNESPEVLKVLDTPKTIGFAQGMEIIRIVIDENNTTDIGLLSTMY